MPMFSMSFPISAELRLHNDTSAEIGVVVYGFNPYTSYGYPGGLQLTPLQCMIVYM